MSRPIDHRFARGAHSWRVQSDEQGRFDEIVVKIGRAPKPGSREKGGNGLILHAEMMNNRSCFVDVAGLCFWVTVGRDGVARITNQEDRR